MKESVPVDDAAIADAVELSSSMLKGVWVAVLCVLGLTFSVMEVRPLPVILPEEKIPGRKNLQSYDVVNEHQQLRRNLTKRKPLQTQKQQNKAKRELKQLQKYFVDCSQYQYTLAITDTLRINYVLVIDESSPGGGIFKAELVYLGKAWLGFGHSELGSMMGSLAIIGDPDAPSTDYQVQKYNLTGQDLEGIRPLLPAQQTLLDTSLEQTGSVTTMRFTKLLNEQSELRIHPSLQNTFLFAHGSSNTLGFHAVRGVLVLDLIPCLQSKRSYSILPGERIDESQQDRYEATSNYVIGIGEDLSTQQGPKPIIPIEYKQFVTAEQKPQQAEESENSAQAKELSSSKSEEVIQFDIPDQFTVDDDHLKNLPTSNTPPTKGTRIWLSLHGFFSMVTCGVLLPVVITSTALQGYCSTGTKRRTSHVDVIRQGSGFLLILGVLATFITAVFGATNDTTRNYSPVEKLVSYSDTISSPRGAEPASYHSPAGLALFIACLFFALTGTLRSFLTTPDGSSSSKANIGEQEGDEGRHSDFDSDTVKSTEAGLAKIASRWDKCHSLLGVFLLFVCWWECQSGLDVFVNRFSDSWFTPTFFWTITGTFAGVLGFACFLQLVTYW